MLKSAGNETPQKDLTRSMAPLLGLYMMAQPVVTVLVRYLSFHFDAVTMNFYRLFTGSIALLLICYFALGDDLKRTLRNRRQMGRIALFTVASVVFLYSFVKGTARTSAVITELTLILRVPFTVLLATLIFADERKIITSRKFILGALLAAGGTAGVILTQRDITWEYSLGSLFLLVTVVAGSLGTLLKKKLVFRSHPLCVAGLSTAMSCIVFFFASLIWGDLGKVARVPTFTVAVLLLSGVYGMIAGIGFNLFIIRKVGIVISRFVELGWPLAAGIYSYFLLREILTSVQMVFGAVLICGCFLALSGNRRAGFTRLARNDVV